MEVNPIKKTSNPFSLGLPLESPGYAVAALLAIVFAVPFFGRILFHNEIGPWNNFAQAFFHTHLELFLGNACLGELFFLKTTARHYFDCERSL